MQQTLETRLTTLELRVEAISEALADLTYYVTRSRSRSRRGRRLRRSSSADGAAAEQQQQSRTPWIHLE